MNRAKGLEKTGKGRGECARNHLLVGLKQSCVSTTRIRNCRALVLAGKNRGPDFCLEQ